MGQLEPSHTAGETATWCCYVENTEVPQDINYRSITRSSNCICGCSKKFNIGTEIGIFKLMVTAALGTIAKTARMSITR